MSHFSEFVQRTLAATHDAYGKVASFHTYLEEGERGTQQSSYATLASWLTSAGGNQHSQRQPARQQDYIHLKRTRRKSGEEQTPRSRSPRDTSPRSPIRRQATPPADTPDHSDTDPAAESDHEDNVSFTDADDDDEDAEAEARNDAGPQATRTSASVGTGNVAHETAAVAQPESLGAAETLLGLDGSSSVDNLISELDGILGLSANKDASLEGDAPNDGASGTNA
jgi:hypothetical protein